MTQSAMCIPLWPARNGNTAHLVMCPFAGGSSSAFRHWQAEQLDYAKQHVLILTS
nr:hypothetical protein [Escherichia coli]